MPNNKNNGTTTTRRDQEVTISVGRLVCWSHFYFDMRMAFTAAAQIIAAQPPPQPPTQPPATGAARQCLRQGLPCIRTALLLDTQFFLLCLKVIQFYIEYYR